MRDGVISSVVLVENEKPFGIVTERGLVWRVLAAGRDPDSLTALDIYSKPVVASSELTELENAIDLMKENKIRRIVVVGMNVKVTGVLTTDDVDYNLKGMSENLAVKYMMISEKRKTI